MVYLENNLTIKQGELQEMAIYNFAAGPAMLPKDVMKRDSSGKIIQTRNKVGDMTVYRDAKGKTVMTKTKVGNTSVYRNSNGSIKYTKH